MRYWMLVLAAAWGLGGCGSTPIATRADLADDFAISITVLPAAEDPAPCWFIVGPDGVLHGALGERTEASVQPGGVRRLSRAQVRHLHDIADSAGLLATPPYANLVSPMEPNAPSAAAIVDVASMGRRTTGMIPLDDAPAVAGVRELVAEMRRLAWAE